MSYADGLLSTGERIIVPQQAAPVRLHLGRALRDPGRHHRRRRCSGSAAVCRPTASAGRLATVLGWMTAILFVGGIAVVVWTALRYINQEYVLTNRRVIQVEGVLNRNSTDSSLEKINDAVLSQSSSGGCSTSAT